ncbi:AAA family ATPase [Larkinella soli]|uniref:AAA family ATPase n=1 Tax=Larkinella soli TaxID=1770527 RepID=UPI0013E2E1AB|nr:AAA family ATPase [Larkinella soli]
MLPTANNLQLQLPQFSLVLLVGVSGAGKTTFARRHFRPTEVVSSDHCRALVADDENDQSATSDAFELLHFLTAKRLKRGRLTVIDATNVQPPARESLLALAGEYRCPVVGIVFDMPEAVLVERRKNRTDRAFGDHVLHRQRRDLWLDVRYMEYEGFKQVYRLRSPEEVDRVTIVIQTSPSPGRES